MPKDRSKSKHIRVPSGLSTGRPKGPNPPVISSLPIVNPSDWHKRYQALLTKEGRRHWLAQVAALPQHKMSDRQRALRHLSEIDGDYEMAKITVTQEANLLAAEAHQTTVKIVRPKLADELPQDMQDLLDGKLVEMPQEPPALPSEPVIDFFPELRAMQVESVGGSDHADPKPSPDSGSPPACIQVLSTDPEPTQD